MNGQYEHKMEINNLIRQVMEGAKPSELEGILYYQDQIAEVAELVAAHERELCITDIQWHIPRSSRDDPEYLRAKSMIKRIRARGKHE